MHNNFVRFFLRGCLLGIFMLGGASFSLPRADAKEVDESKLTLKRIFEGDDFAEESFGPARWLPDSSGYVIVEKSEGKAGGKDLVFYAPESDEKKVWVASRHLIPSGETQPLSIEDYSWSCDGAYLLIYTNSRRVWRANTRGDYWVFDVTSHELRQLGGDALPSTLMFAEFSPVDHRVAYVHERNLFVEDWKEGTITQLTQDGGEHLINGTFDWVYEEEFRLRKGYQWSPDGSKIAYWQINTEGVGVFHLIDNVDGLYPKLIPIPYPKAGEKNSACRVGVVSASGGRTRWVPVPGDPRNHYIAYLDWADDSETVIVQQLNRLQNTNRLMVSTAGSDAVETVLTDRDEAWVEEVKPLRWLEDGERFLWLSERDGWRHLYVADRFGREFRLLTNGDYDVIGLDGIDEKEGLVYFTASPENPTQRYLYRIPLAGGEAVRVSPSEQPGVHSYQMSPNGRYAIHSYSSANEPLVRDLVALPEHKLLRPLTDNSELREALGKLDRNPVEFFRVAIADDVALDAWMMSPPKIDPGKKYPLLVFVYGEPAAQTVMDRWGGKRYLWHLMHTQNGYFVTSIDNRGTPAPRGRGWRKIIYRQVGILAPKDQAAALDQLLEQRPLLDPERVGIWGWSGGGSMTLNMMFKYPEKYAVGMSIAPVPNQRFYDTIYQERYMGLPKDNVAGFRDGSPIHFAARLRGDLLIVHGTGDDNVHYQGTEALINELVAFNKPFTMMAYPNRTHSLREGVNTTPHLYALLTRYLYKSLPGGGR
ncbi:MAG: Dipeptidyl aminopeptidase 4 [Verrucomicrobia subdivision 3 bacterium]|nr:Dipeptidyl aminopeptidase 4 [Limisphaerales bacterium]MCS1414103.1 Dipeptidyl aminopeptidase 4 [Limisphaerales bacterium]